MTAVKLDKNAARDIWAAELRNGAEAAYRFGPVTGNLVAVLRELHESVDGGADDPLGFFLSEPGDKRLPEAKEVHSVGSGQIPKHRREFVTYCLIYLLFKDIGLPRGDLFEVTFNTILESLLVERLKEWKSDSTALNPRDDDAGGLVGGKGV